MRINVMTTRPSLPLTLACAPSVSPLMPIAAPVAAPVMGVERAPASRVHQVPVEQVPVEQVLVEQVLVEQAQSVKAGLVQLAAAPAGIEGITGTNGNGTNGFLGLGVSGGSARIDSKRSYTDSDGVPPRGRPV